MSIQSAQPSERATGISPGWLTSRSRAAGGGGGSQHVALAEQTDRGQTEGEEEGQGEFPLGAIHKGRPQNFRVF